MFQWRRGALSPTVYNHYNSSHDKSINIWSMFEHLMIEKEEIFESSKNVVFLSLEKQLHIALDAALPEHLTWGILDHITGEVRQDLELNYMKMPKTPSVTIYKEVWAKSLDGSKSIIQTFLSHPHSSKHCFLALTKQYHLTTYLKIWFSIIFWSWVWLLFPSCRLWWWLDQMSACIVFIFNNDDVHYCDAHIDVKEMITKTPDKSKDMRGVILRVWFDGFEAHNVKGNARFNGL